MKILYNARIYTQDETRPLAAALIVQGERILAVGQSEALLTEAVSGAERLDLSGRTILPGLTDAHLHLEQYARSLALVDCETPTREICLHRVAERARQTPPGEWVLGHGWNQNDWPEGLGTAADLDAVAPNHPAFLTAKSLHAGWANTAALRRANLEDGSGDPPDGRLGRDAANRLDGILYEAAMDLINDVLPQSTDEQVAEGIAHAQPVLWRMGLTGVHDFDRRRCFSALQMLHRDHRLGLRVLKSIPFEDLEQAVALGLRTGFGDDFLRIGSVKAFADGALGPHTSAMLQPYEDDPQNRGMLMLDAETFFEQGRQAVQNGLSLAVHAIGDRANHEVLNAFTQLRRLEMQNQPGLKLRHRIEHVQLIHPEDVGHLAELDLVASMQPIHAISDMRMADRLWGARSKLAYAWRAQLDADARLAFGSDAPVESPNPFWGLHAAITRRRPDGSPGAEGWIPEQRITMQEALQAYTTGPAFAAGMEDRLGRLSPGFLADLIVLDRDPFRCEADEIRAVKPLATMVAGRWVHRTFD